jgi:glycerol uptake facilitator-like aquaporin
MTTSEHTPQKLTERDVPRWVAGLTIGVLGILLVGLTGFAFFVNRDAGWGFLVTAAGLFITLITRKSNSYWAWACSLALSLAGLLLVLVNLPKLVG